MLFDFTNTGLPIELAKHITSFFDEETWTRFNETCKTYSYTSWWSDHRVTLFKNKYMGNLISLTFSNQIEFITVDPDNFKYTERFQNFTAFPLHVNMNGGMKAQSMVDFRKIPTVNRLEAVTAIRWSSVLYSTEGDIQTALAACSNVQEIRFSTEESGNYPPPDLLTVNIPPSTTVKELTIDDDHLHGPKRALLANGFFLDLIKLFPNLTTLKVWRCDGIGLGSLDIKQIQLASLKTLLIHRCCNLQLSDLVAMCTACPHLEKLSIYGSDIKVVNTRKLQNASLPSVIKLSLDVSTYFENDLGRLLALCKNVQEITFCHSDIDGVDSEDEEEVEQINYLSFFLENNADVYPSVTHITLEDSEITKAVGLNHVPLFFQRFPNAQEILVYSGANTFTIPRSVLRN
jgi:hypothetical protein